MAFPLAGMKYSITSSFPLAGKTASAVRLGIEKMEQNRFTPNVKNIVHREKQKSREKFRIKA